MIKYDDITKDDIKEHKKSKLVSNYWSFIQNIVIGGSRSGKANALLDLIKQQNDDDYIIINKIYLYLKGLNEAKNH